MLFCPQVTVAPATTRPSNCIHKRLHYNGHQNKTQALVWSNLASGLCAKTWTTQSVCGWNLTASHCTTLQLRGLPSVPDSMRQCRYHGQPDAHLKSSMVALWPPPDYVPCLIAAIAKLINGCANRAKPGVRSQSSCRTYVTIEIF